MKPRNAPLARKASIGLFALVLAVVAMVFAYQAGCNHTGAGSTVVSEDYQLASVWLMIPSLVLFSALFSLPVAESVLRTAWRTAGFLLVAGPLALVVLLSIESQGDQQCQANGRHTRVQGIGRATNGAYALR